MSEQAPLSAEALERFRAALRLSTEWPGEAAPDSKARREAEAALAAFQAYLQSAYPAFHAAAEGRTPSPYGLLYRWPARSRAKAVPAPAASPRPEPEPVLLLAHYDVVPAEREAWSRDPYGAELAEGHVYGRGALDTKCSLFAAMEALEEAAARGAYPERDVYVAFGGDEERSGEGGAKAMAALLEAEGVRFAWALDEGSIVAEGLMPGVERPLALVGVEEKGLLDLELIVHQEPGHASRPPKVQAAAVLGAALDRLSRRPFPFALIPTVESFFKSLSGELSGARAAVLSRPRALGPLFFALAGGSPETAALLRTTLAMTQLSGSPADNVLPSQARAVLNLRLLPGWSVAAATDYVRRAVADPRVEVRVYPERAASEAVPADPETSRGRGPGWAEISAAIGAAFPNALVTPFLVTATTDSRHYARLCRAVYRFAPLKLDSGELARVHGHDERISLGNLAAGVEFYRSLVASLCGETRRG